MREKGSCIISIEKEVIDNGRELANSSTIPLEHLGSITTLFSVAGESVWLSESIW